MLQIVAFFLTRTVHVLPNTELECASCVCTEYQNLESSRIQCCIQKMWLGGQTEFPKCTKWGGEGVYDILTFQKSRGPWIAVLYKTAHFQEVRAHGGISVAHGMPH